MSGQQTTPSTGKTTRKPGVNFIPKGYHTVTPYLVVENASKLLDFLTRAFGAKEITRMQGPDGKIGHAEVLLGDSHIMLGESMGDFKALPCSLYLYVEDADGTFRRAVDAGGKVVQELKDQFYGDRSGCVKDPLGNSWWIATHVEDIPQDELMRRGKEEMKKMQKH